MTVQGTPRAARRRLTHVDRAGRPRMVDVSEKPPTVRRAVPWLVATAALGALFLAGEWTAWPQPRMAWANFRVAQGGHFFPPLLATHGLHLLLGLLALVAVFPALLVAKRMEVRQVIVDCAAWYWYAMCLLWVFLFGLLLGAR